MPAVNPIDNSQSDEQICDERNPLLPQEEFDLEHFSGKRLSLDQFEKDKKVESGDQFVNECRQRLTDEIDANYVIFNEQNQVKMEISQTARGAIAAVGAVVAEGALLSFLPAAVALPFVAHALIPVAALCAAYVGVKYMERPLNRAKLKLWKWTPSWIAGKV